MRLPISIDHDSLRYGTSVIFDSAATLSFASQKSLGFRVQGLRSPTSSFIIFIDNEIGNAIIQRHFLQQCVHFAEIHFFVSDFMLCRISNASNSCFGLPTMKELKVSIRLSNNLTLIGDQPFNFLVSHNHDGSLACWLIHPQSKYFDKGRSYQAHLQ